MIIKKISGETTYVRKAETFEFEVNGEQVEVRTWFEDDVMGSYDSDREVEYVGALTDEQKEEFEDYLDDALDLEDGKELETSADTTKPLREITLAS